MHIALIIVNSIANLKQQNVLYILQHNQCNDIAKSIQILNKQHNGLLDNSATNTETCRRYSNVSPCIFQFNN